MKVGLFIPCFMDQLFPDSAMATLQLLEKQGLQVEYPLQQTCCGQPMANSGCSSEARDLAKRFIQIFKQYDAIVCPSGSCTSMVRNHYNDFFDTQEEFSNIKDKTYELCEFLIDVINIKEIKTCFPYKVGLHQSCHGLRELRLAQSSERNLQPFSKVKQLLNMVQDLELVELNRTDECCGFGGTFAVYEETISCSMGRDRIADHLQAGAQVLTGIDSSCLMHLNGLMQRSGSQLPVFHIAEILNGQASI